MLRAHFILGSFCWIFRENYELHVIIYTHFSVLRLVMILLYVLQVFGPFGPHFEPIECVLTPHRWHNSPCPWRRKRTQRTLRQRLPWTLYGECHGPWWAWNCLPLHLPSSCGRRRLSLCLNGVFSDTTKVEHRNPRHLTLISIISFSIFQVFFRVREWIGLED